MVIRHLIINPKINNNLTLLRTIYFSYVPLTTLKKSPQISYAPTPIPKLYINKFYLMLWPKKRK
jgi:hypothetical protein